MVLPITIEEAKRQARIDDDDRDADVVGYIRDAVSWAEGYTGHLLTERAVTETFDSFDRLRLRAWPIATDAIAAVTYSDASGVHTVTGARIVARPRPARLLPALGARWPYLHPAAGAITVSVTAGYVTPDKIPGVIMRAMLILIAAYERDREGGDVLEQSIARAEQMCRGQRLWTL